MVRNFWYILYMPQCSVTYTNWPYEDTGSAGKQDWERRATFSVSLILPVVSVERLLGRIIRCKVAYTSIANGQKKEVLMAALTKHTESGVYYHLCHNTREYGPGKAPRNIEIDQKRMALNYTLHPSDRGKDAGDHRQSMKYYRQRMKSVYKMDRKDTVCTAEWCVTAPHDLPKQEQKAFFESVYEFMNSKYGEKNCIQCITHFDEGVKNGKGEVIAGSPHMHYTFLATKEVDNQKEYAEKLELIQEKYKEDPRGYEKAKNRLDHSKKYKYPEKLDFKGVLNRKHLQTFHPELQAWLDKAGIQGSVYNGATGGSNRSVVELKLETKEKLLVKEKQRNKELERKNKALKEQVKALQKRVNSTAVPGKAGWKAQIHWGNRDIEQEL